MLGYQGLPKYRRGLSMNHAAMRSAAAEMEDALMAPALDLRSSKFSGGNQQKLVLAREIGEQPQVLLVGQTHARRGHRRHRVHPRPAARLR